jgi:ABC-type oligopeptide transport system substrate-binding subunit/predicted Ser/Thr protein kinase
MIGTRVNNRYQIDCELGQGGMGTVFKGYDSILERDVALKMLTDSGLGTQGRSRLVQEAKAIAKLSHPNIITVFDVGEYQDSPYIVMEFVEGVNLYDHKPKDIEEIVPIMQQVCAALAHAHEQGIIHRDLKPENVIITAEGTAMLMDFGLARSMTSRLTTEGTILGTVFYLAPEQAQGKAIDPRSDLYSLGVMLYELTTGELPFVADDPLAVVSQHIHAPVVPPRAKNDQIPAALESLILDLLEKDPKNRPASAREVLARLSSPEVLDVKALPAEELSVMDRIVQGRLAGRVEELRQARQIWGQAVGGKGQLLLISGEPGVGKTRLMREIVTQAEVSGGATLIGRSYAEGDPPYSPFRQILRAVFTLSRKSGVEIPVGVLGDLLTIAPELRADFPDLHEYDAEDAAKELQRIFDQFLVLFNLLTKHTPVLLVLEDAHWTDASSLKLLRHLVRNTRSQQMMILATYREVELDEARALHETLLDFQREKLGTRLKLKRLTRQETHDMLAVLFAEEISPDFLEGIYRETDGNPFFIEEVCKAIVESGKLTYEEGRWKRPSMEEVGVPQSIQVAIQSRIRVLSENTQKALEQAAILGREFDFELLQHALDTNEDSLLDALDEALHARLVEEVEGNGKDRFGFVHALIPTAITASLRTLNRRRLHKRAAGAQEALQPEAYEALAYQHIEAGETDQGVDYLIKAGDRARELFAHEEAITSYQQAVDYLRESGEQGQAAKTLMKLGLTYHSDFQFTEAHQAYDQAFDLWELAGRLEVGESRPAALHPLRILSGDLVTIDPAFIAEPNSIQIVIQLFSGLVAMSPKGNVLPDIARSWDVLDGGKRYVFHLRGDVFWSDDVPVTSRDFEFAVKRALQPGSTSPNAVLQYEIKNARPYHTGQLPDPDLVGICARDKYTLEIELENPTAYFLQLLGTIAFMPVPRHTVEAYGDNWTGIQNFVSNGAFQLDSWEPGKSITLKKNPRYHGKVGGNLLSIKILFPNQIKNPFRAYLNDELDLLLGENLTTDLQVYARQYLSDEFFSIPQLGAVYVTLSTNSEPFNDPRVRQAFALATDRETVVRKANHGFVSPATGGLLPPGMPGYVPDIALPFDPGRARSLLAEAGFPEGKGFPVVEGIYILSSDFQESRIETVKILKDMWLENLGIQVNWTQFTWKDIIPRLMSEKPALLIGGWVADYFDPHNFFADAWWNRLADQENLWDHQEYTSLIRKAKEILNQEERIKLYMQADRIIVEETPIFTLNYGSLNYLQKPWVKGFTIHPNRFMSFKDVIIEPH